MASTEDLSTLDAIREENQRLMDEIQKLVMHNTKRQRELLSLNAERDEIIAQGHEQVRELTEELKQLDSEYASVKMECDRLISAITQTGNGDIRQALDLTRDYDAIEEEDTHSDHSTISSGSTASSSSSTLSSSGGPTGRPPMVRGQPKKMSIDIDLERMELDPSPVEPATVSKPYKKIQSMPVLPAEQLLGVSPRTPTTRATSRSDQNSFRLSQLPPQHKQQHSKSSPMLAYKAHSVLKTTQAHLNNFRRHSGSQRRMRDAVVS
ncbi:hypothetical protein P43SY_004096 [Pythium insidiosum]|uniref:Uncharacterized protein n=1 Tax=Pythium insidiosum TaxID=114742 RepID=A0AAD5Q7H8_PYTIN|nr:hypothetical protein P43SY_004096 [Pythium insidiosum]KAJ0405296.1 hypothetical protein ATCC90586_007335 [Pythium insidiosum]